ncbi:MAG: TIR domain-containing protein [Flavitalea sp.]
MPNETVLVSQTSFDNYFDQLMNEFSISMNAFQLQDISTAEKASMKAKNIQKMVVNKFSAPQFGAVKLMVMYIELCERLIRSGYYTAEEKHKKSLEEAEAALKICDEMYTILGKIPRDAPELSDLTIIIDVFPFLCKYFEHTSRAMLGIKKVDLEKSAFKYVDEVAVYMESATEFRKINDVPFGNVTPDFENMFVALASMLNKLADIYEGKAERLEESRKRIQFLAPIDTKVFIVHGHNEVALRELERILESFKLDPIVLKDETDNGRTIIEKFEHYGRLCGFAFIIVTPDDWVENKKQKYFQARPNVLFELGWFSGRYGRDKVRVLVQKGTPLPSDLNGLVTIEFNDKVEEAYRKIREDLQTAGIPVS